MSVCVVADYLKINCKDLYDEIYNRGYKDGFNVDKSEERNKAIDDFVDKVEFVVGAEDRDIYCKEIVKEVAEQLKAGGSDG